MTHKGNGELDETRIKETETTTMRMPENVVDLKTHVTGCIAARLDEVFDLTNCSIRIAYEKNLNGVTDTIELGTDLDRGTLDNSFVFLLTDDGLATFDLDERQKGAIHGHHGELIVACFQIDKAF